MLKRYAIQILRRAGHTQAKVAELTGVSEREVRRVEREPEVQDVDDSAVRSERGVGRPSKAEPFRTQVKELLEKEPELLTVEILRRMRLEGYDGAKTVMYTLVKSLRSRKVRPMTRFEGLPAEFSQHDFGEVRVRFLDGTVKRIQFFASRLKYSRWVSVTLVEDQCVETLVRALLAHLVAFGGRPLVAVFDRPKTIALKWNVNGEVTEWNPTFAAFALELGLGVEVCWPASPRQKGSVENLVGWVKGSFFKQRRFLDEEDLKRQLAEWMVEVNETRPSRATKVIPAIRLAEERPRLRPLKLKPEDLALRIPIVVGPTGMVNHEGRLYSMPADSISIGGTLFLYQDRVRIVVDRHEALHPRLFEPGARSILPEHRALAVSAVSGKRARRYLKREHILALGQEAFAYLTELVHRRPGLWISDVDQIHELLQLYDDGVLRQALRRGLREQLFGAEYIRHYLSGAPQRVIHMGVAAGHQKPADRGPLVDNPKGAAV